MAVPRLDPERTAVLIVDMQQRLVEIVREPALLVRQTARLLDLAAALNLPVLATRQYPQRLGPVVDELGPRLQRAVCDHEKLKFSACIEPVREELVRRQVRCVLVAGIEAHVCVLQTCLDLMERGYVTAVAVDAISSRRELDQQVALRRMEQLGVMPTTVESAMLELVREAGTEQFKAVLPLIK